MDKILLMLQLQAELNEATNGDNWTSGITKNNKVINWKRCIYMECAEMIDSFTWKHWKNIDKEADWDNLQIEVVDVWHFIMSLAIENYSQTRRGRIDDLAQNISELDSFAKINKKHALFAVQNDVIEKIESIMIDTLSRGALNLEKLISDFFDLVLMAGLDLESLYKLYVGKNILNQFRQDHGYKDGSYIKVWGCEEDNVVMKRVLDENSSVKPSELYRELTKLYLALNKS
ncbi:MAG: dUTPase [Sulfurimonas sp. RIFCSPLOWO2_12_FULL_36_74]|uniref:dUTP diphosphatase n=1 Tax=Sulfurimonas sp. RIFCSPLOWO2_12_36_12 TaxID=1802253 RepID=UPI0008AEF66E|nr:dUTP diphosphatase [Sulfurimonas sp. RIFCSPLOWO2_12_36_12]OHE01193.1 MAG: dUTPase [Sulfurimonas sp. RIFCSPLOWO2_12_36_12]OHE07106.1 MAG: dUTPase [Sulfurimonas sp. RIFCSPLOWO2_12_FULL_36_74]